MSETLSLVVTDGYRFGGTFIRMPRVATVSVNPFLLLLSLVVPIVCPLVGIINWFKDGAPRRNTEDPDYGYFSIL